VTINICRLHALSFRSHSAVPTVQRSWQSPPARLILALLVEQLADAARATELRAVNVLFEAATRGHRRSAAVDALNLPRPPGQFAPYFQAGRALKRRPPANRGDVA
jgi:hypothetical protein